MDHDHFRSTQPPSFHNNNIHRMQHTNKSYKNQNSSIPTMGIDVQQQYQRSSQKKAIQDIVKYIIRLQQQGLDIILIIYANTTRENKDGIIYKLINTCQLIETIEKENTSSTYARGNSQIDFILCSQHIHPYISFATIQQFGTICMSDHKSILIDIDLNKYKHNSIYFQAASYKRIIS